MRGVNLGSRSEVKRRADSHFAHVVTAVEFVVSESVESPDEKALMRRDEIDVGRAPLDPMAEPLEQNISDIAPQEAQP
jgi:hypothetical protein